jgi:hypothetical protein
MLHHYVFLKFAKGTPETHIAEFCTRMQALCSTVPGIEQLLIGRDMLHEARSWDLILDMRFTSVETLRHYQQHPAHQAVMAFNGPHVAEVGAVDCLLP